MARPLRIEYPGAWYHVMNRGVARRAIFTDETQRHYFLSLLADAARRFQAEWHAYCLMTNHYHLLLRTPEGNLQRIMRHVNGVYTQYYNRMTGRDGPLFRGRYKAVLVDAQAYWAQLSRYIHRNPLEAGIVKQLSAYRWSSYRAYIGETSPPDWLICEEILNTIARSNVRARYRAYVESEAEGEVAAFYSGQRHGPVLGDEAFKRRHAIKGKRVDVPQLRNVSARPSADQIVAAVSHHLGVASETIWTRARSRHVANPGRGMAMYLCQQMGDLRLAEIAERFGLKHYASASTSIRQFRARLSEDRELQKALDAIKPELDL